MKKKTFIVQLLDSKKPNRKSFTQVEDANFYSNDTDASLVFIPHEDIFDFETAKVVMYNRSDESLVERDAVVTTEDGRKVASYEMPDEIIAHWGDWTAQPVFISGGEIYSGSIVPFSVFRYLMHERPPKLNEVVTITNFIQQSQALVDAMAQEEAQRVTQEQSRQSAEAVRVQGYQEIQQIIEDGALNAVPKDGSITTEKFADKAVTPYKTTFIKNGKNLFDVNNVKENYMFDSSGNETAQKGYVISNSIPVKLNQPIHFTYGTSLPRTHLTSNRIVLYKSDGSFLQVLSGFESGNVIGNTEAHTFKASFTENVANNLLQIEYGEATDYETYRYSLDNSIKISGENLTGADFNVEVDDNAVTNQKIAPQAVSEDKTTFLPIGRNKFDPEAIKPDVMFNSAGDEVVHENYCLTGYIPVSDGARPYISFNGTEIMSNRIVLYDHKQNKIRVISGFASGTIINEPNVEFMRLSITKAVAQGKFQVEFDELTPYEEFHFQMSSRVKIGDKRLTGKTMIAFGDSITQDANERSHYPLYFEDLTGVRYINQGYGGTTMSRHTLEEFRPFSVTNLLKAKIDNDYSDQEMVITAWQNGTQEEILRAGNYRLQLDKWKSVDLNEVYAVTLLLGANDHGATIGEIDSIDPEGATFIGAYNHVIKTLQTMYPSLRMILITPIYREHAEGVVDRTPLFVQAVKDVGEHNNLPVYDAYHNLGFNKYNWKTHYSTDGLHPIIEVGQPRMGEAISRYLDSVI